MHDPVLEALTAEISRAMEALTAEGEPPHYLALRANDRRRLAMSSVDGGAARCSRSHKRSLDVSARAGSPELDSTHPIKGSWDRPSPVRVRLPIEDDDLALRTAIWGAIRAAVASARERLMRVCANQAIRARDEDPSPDFSNEPPCVQLIAVEPAALEEQDWPAQLSALAQEASEHPLIERSRADLEVIQEIRWFVASDGTRLRHDRRWTRVSLSVETTAQDGGELSLYRWVDASDPSRLPRGEELRAWARALREELLKQREAEIGEPYRGPLLLRGRAAGVFIHEVLGHRIEGHRQKDEEEGQTFRGRVGQPILLSSLSIIDDPTLPRLGETDLNGHYRYDDEGVPAERVVIVENGVFRSFLMGRSPIRGFPRSNGHGRAATGHEPVSRMASTIVSTSDPVPVSVLKERLREEVRAQGLPYGLMVDEIEGGFTLTGRSLPNSFSVQAAVIFRVWADGRPDDRIRGLDLVGTPLAALGSILAAGDDLAVFNGFCGAESGSVPNSAASPSLLIGAIEAQRQDHGSERPPLLPKPERASGDPLKEELARAAEGLHVAGTQEPYHISLLLSEYDEIEIIGSLGGLVSSSASPKRTLGALVRVGSPALDNTNFESWEPGHSAAALCPALSPRTDALATWRLLDLCYKSAVETLAAKEAARSRHPAEPGSADFAPAGPVCDTLPAARSAPGDQALLERIVREMSAELRSCDAADWSRVYALSAHGRFRALDTGGTDVSGPISEVAVRVVARVRAEDGAVGLDQRLFVAREVSALPVDEMIRACRALKDGLCAWASSPVYRDELVGPVLFEGEAATALVRWLLLPLLRGTPPLEPDPDGASAGLPQRSPARLKRRLLPPGFSVIDDPERDPSHPASYRYDLEGMKARRVLAVEDGVLRAHLMSRIPCRTEAESTGHARFASGDLPRAQASLLTVEGPARDDLHEQALALARGYGLEKYVVISRMRADSLARLPSLRERTYGIIGEDLRPPVPVEMALVDARGARTPLRGLGIAQLDAGALKTAMAGARTTRSPYIVSQDGWESEISALGGFPVDVGAPDILLHEVELNPMDQTERLPPIAAPRR